MDEAIAEARNRSTVENGQSVHTLYEPHPNHLQLFALNAESFQDLNTLIDTEGEAHSCQLSC